MNAAQTAKYFWEWGRVRDILLKRGLSHAQADARRHELHRKALGRPKSSKEFSNADLDAVLAAFLAVSEGGNLDAQLAQLDMPEKRTAMAVRRIGVMMLHLNLETGRESGYVAGIARNLFGHDDGQWHQLNAAQLGQLEGVIVRRLKQLHAPDKVAAIEAEAKVHAEECARKYDRPLAVAAEEGNPF
ncbi:MAG: hypothetical protein JNK23_10435 [Opitutaceae bacterium]|nr:hypothetical protein [Opitutaceae bacterium]